jgi:hypothetical protein
MWKIHKEYFYVADGKVFTTLKESLKLKYFLNASSGPKFKRAN